MAAVGLAIAAFAFAYVPAQPNEGSSSGLGAPTPNANAPGAPATPSSGASDHPPSIDLSESQLSSVKVEPVGEREFLIEKQAVGSINFNEDMTLQVFT
ncbi:MAG: efflux transporter periplasmic adaptor subunit, partial [Methyloceanibacter sp.]